jgi:hypothetical protein
MKVIITENKRNRAITKWLDETYGDLEKYSAPGSFRYIYYRDNNGGNVFNFNRNTGVVTIVNEILYQDLKHMFGLNGYELNDILIPWLMERYNLHVEKVQYAEFTHLS